MYLDMTHHDTYHHGLLMEYMYHYEIYAPGCHGYVNAYCAVPLLLNILILLLLLCALLGRVDITMQWTLY